MPLGLDTTLLPTKPDASDCPYSIFLARLIVRLIAKSRVSIVIHTCAALHTSKLLILNTDLDNLIDPLVRRNVDIKLVR
jgi:hypothetical protein